MDPKNEGQNTIKELRQRAQDLCGNVYHIPAKLGLNAEEFGREQAELQTAFNSFMNSEAKFPASSAERLVTTSLKVIDTYVNVPGLQDKCTEFRTEGNAILAALTSFVPPELNQGYPKNNVACSI